MVDPNVQAPPTADSREAEVLAPRPGEANEAEQPDVALVEADLLVEDVSIDGMCGVY